MKIPRLVPWLVVASIVHSSVLAAALSSAFTYQGRLQDGSQLVTGRYDLRFALFDSATGGGMVGSALTNLATPVSQGVFTVSLDFGTGVWDGNDRWLEMAVRTNGTGLFLPLAPRQPLAPVPYAQYAPSAGISSVANAVPAGAISSAMLADGAVTSGKLGAGAIKASNIDDGGAAAYDQFVGSVRSMGVSDPLSFSGLWPVAPNTAPALTFAVDGSNLEPVVGFVGREGLSEPYRFAVAVVQPSAGLVPEEQLGRVGRLTFTRSGRSTIFAGLVTGCSVSSYDGHSALYTFSLESPLAYLALSTDYRIRQELSVPDLAAQLYSDANFSLGVTYPKRSCVIQFAETRLNFFSRLLEDEGIFYFFRQDVTPPSLVLADRVQAYLPGPVSVYRYYGNLATNVTTGELVRSFHKGGREFTRTATIKSYDFQRPSLQLEGSRSAATGQGEAYTFGSSAGTPAAVTAQAALRQQRQDVERALLSGTANAPDLRPGYTFTLDDRSGSELAGTYVVTAVRHAAFRRATNGGASLHYGNQFEVIPASQIYRPALTSPKPLAQACTAKVMGPAGQTRPHVDEHGRVKVQFHWDRYGTNDDRSSGWIRVANPVAGPSHGMLFLPRPGDEVLVEFIQGDPDQPVVTGSFYNNEAMPSYPLPTERDVSYVRSASLQNQVNEIRFDDTPGSEEMRLTARTLRFEVSDGMDLDVTEGIGIGAPHTAAYPLNIGGTILAGGFQGNGSALTDLRASALTGTISEVQIPDNFARLDQDQTFSRSVAARVFIGGGAGLSNLPAASLTGTISDARLSGNVARLNGNPTFNGTVTANLFQGDGAGLTNVSAPSLAGTMPDARLSTNVARLDATQSYTGSNSFLGKVGVGGGTGVDALNIGGNARLNNHELYLRHDDDANHGLGWYGDTKLFAGVNIDGPVLYGCAGGGLATVCDTPQLALAWNNAGLVMIDPLSANNGTYAPGLSFGAASREGIASKRTPGGNQYGLDFYTFGTNRMSLTQGGRVGIGTTAPLKALDVLDGSGANGMGGNLHVGGPSSGPDPKLIHFGDLQTSTGLGYVYLGERGEDDTLELRATRFYFNYGKVGVGVTNPATPLEVAGTVRATRFEGDGTALTGLSSVRSWQIVTSATVNAVANRGYVANSASAISFVLPSAATLGDIVRITGLGAGGWQVDAGLLGIVQGQAQNSVELLCITNGHWRILSRN